MPSGVPNEEGLRALGRMAPGGTADMVANEKGLRDLGARIDEAHGGAGGRRRGGRAAHAAGGGRRRSRHPRVKWALIVCGVVIVLLAGGAYGDFWYINHKIHHEVVHGLVTGPTKGVDAGTENILMVGSTNRCALTQQTPAYGLCTEGVTGVNSDVVMVLHLNPSVPSVSILSIPRDLFIPNARKTTGTLTGANKIDAGLYNGPTQLVASIEEDFGIPIQHYVELNFDTFASVVTALGGITMYFPDPVFDAESGLYEPNPGCIHLNGKEALQVVRARHLQYKLPTNPTTTRTQWPQEAESDLARIRRDHEFLRVLATAVAKKGLATPIADQKIVSSVAGDLTVDSGFSATDMVTLVLTYHKVNPTKAPQLTMPVLVDQFGNYIYKGGTYGDIEFPDEPQDQTVVDQVLGVTADTNTLTGAPLPSPATVTVSVLNGTGVTNQAATTSAALGKLGFKTVGTGDTSSPAQYSETLVTYAKKTPVDEAAAQLVARSMSGSVIMAYGQTTDGAEVTVTTGTDFSVDASAPAPTTTTTAPAHGKGAGKSKGAGATTTSTAAASTSTAPTATSPTGAAATSGTSGTSGTSSGTTATSSTTTTTVPTSFSAPTTSDQQLAPWDPRACTANGGEGT